MNLGTILGGFGLLPMALSQMMGANKKKKANNTFMPLAQMKPQGLMSQQTGQ